MAEPDIVAIPQDSIETGRIVIALHSGATNNSGVSFSLGGLTHEAVIGALTVVGDRVRDMSRAGWAD